MQSNNFLNKTVKTFLTSLMVSVFVFGSFYFLLSDNSGSTSTPKNNGDVKSDTSKKLVVNDENTTSEKSEDIKSAKVSKQDASVAKTVETERNVLGATTTNLVAQLPTDLTPFVNQTTTTPAAAITGTLPTTLVADTQTAAPIVASGVPKTGNESLYAILGIFSLVTGYLIANGKSLAINSFEREI